MRVWRNWQTRMIQVTPSQCKFGKTAEMRFYVCGSSEMLRLGCPRRVKIRGRKFNMRVWRNWQTRMIQVTPPWCKNEL